MLKSSRGKAQWWSIDYFIPTEDEGKCWRAPEEKLNDGALITLYQLKTKANARLTNIAASDALLRGHSLWTLRFLDSSCIYGSSEMWLEIIICNKPYKHFISFHVSFWASSKLILTFTKWGGVAFKTTSVHGPQCNFHLRNITYVHGRQLPSTCASPQYLIHCFQHEWAKNEFEKQSRKLELVMKRLTLWKKCRSLYSWQLCVMRYKTWCSKEYAHKDSSQTYNEKWKTSKANEIELHFSVWCLIENLLEELISDNG